jgi:hypothetical protein
MFLFMALSYCHKQELKGTKLIIQHTMLDWRRSWAFCVGWSMLTSIAGRTPSSLWEDEKEKLTCGDSRSRRWYAPASGAMAVAQDESSSSDASGNVQICRSCPPSLAAQPSRSDEVVWEEEGKQDRASHGCSSTSRPAPPQAPPPPSAAPDPPPYPIAASRAPSPASTAAQPRLTRTNLVLRDGLLQLLLLAATVVVWFCRAEAGVGRPETRPLERKRGGERERRTRYFDHIEI